MTTRGGARAGAGRKKKDRTPTDAATDAQDYLERVVRGEVDADAVRVSAARCLIQYERAKQRGPVPSKKPSELAEQEAKALEREVAAAFEERAKAIRNRHRRAADG